MNPSPPIIEIHGDDVTVEAIQPVIIRAHVAPTNAVAADLNSAGFSWTATIHAELYALEKGRRSWNAKTVVMVDEAAMIDSALMGQLLHHAQRGGPNSSSPATTVSSRRLRADPFEAE